MQCPEESELVEFAEGCLDEGRRDRVAGHIDECADCGVLVGVVLGSAPRRNPTTTEREAADSEGGLARGTCLGRYIVVSRLGAGGLGVVYHAFDPELDRQVAIKLLRSRPSRERDARTLQARLVREARALARVSHPNVVSVHDIGLVDDQVFVAMELIKGSTLREWLTAADRSWQEIRELFVAAARGLQSIHEAGLVHRDVKPSNVLVGDDGRVRVLDFGLARVIAADRVAAPTDPVPADTAMEVNLTPSGYLLGTPAYMAPEQCNGDEIGPATDQFGFSVALYEAMYGVRPFVSRTIKQQVQRAQQGEFEPPKTQRRIPPTVHAAIVRGLAYDAASRHDSFESYIEALSFDERAVRRRRWRLTAAAALLVLGASGGAVWATAAADDGDRPVVDQLVTEARAAAAKSYFIYPPPEAPQTATAYTQVLALEDLSGALEDAGDDTAERLRGEFSDTLARLGDKYWERPGGRPFATDYYLAALVFDPGNDRVRARSVATTGQLASLTQRAGELEFTGSELAAAVPLAILAEEDSEARRARVRALLGPDSSLPATVAAQLAAVIGDSLPAGQAPPATTRPDGPADAPGETMLAVRDRPRRGEGHRSNRESRRKPDGGAAAAGVERASDAVAQEAPDKAAAVRLATDADLAHKRGDLVEAVRLYNRALDANGRNLRALDGLRQINFDRGAYRQAVGFAERAVRVSRKSYKRRVYLGDLYLRVQQYSEARTQYREAKRLGAPNIQRKLDKVTDKIGP